METVSLDEAQRERAIALAKKLEADEIDSPTDVVTSWEPPSDSLDWDSYREDDVRFEQGEQFVDTAKIKGPLASTEHRLEQQRLKKVLAWLINGEFEVQNIYPPYLEKRGERYYVSTDGHHRCMAAKAVGLDELYVEFEEVPPEYPE